MNTFFHPNQWFHRRNLYGEHQVKMQTHHLFHNEAFWIIAILMPLFIAATFLAILFGSAPPSDVPYMPYFPY